MKWPRAHRTIHSTSWNNSRRRGMINYATAKVLRMKMKWYFHAEALICSGSASPFFLRTHQSARFHRNWRVQPCIPFSLPTCPVCLDSLESLNASDDSVVMNSTSETQACWLRPVFWNPQRFEPTGSNRCAINGGDDVVLFGWSTGVGIGHGVRRDGYRCCNRVSGWITPGQCCGSFEHGINLGGDSHSSLGGKDAYFESTTTAQQWVDSLSVGTMADEPYPCTALKRFCCVGWDPRGCRHPCCP